jgi:hypothetical protein
LKEKTMSGERNLTAESLAEQASAGLERSEVGMVTPQGMMSMSDLAGLAGNASDMAKRVMQFEPMVAGMVSMFFPPAAVAQPFIVMAMPFVIRALDDIAKSNGGDMIGAFLELAQHLTKGAQNSPVLTSPTTMDTPASQDPSAQGSG